VSALVLAASAVPLGDASGCPPDRSGGEGGDGATPGECLSQLGAGADLQLAVDAAEVDLHGLDRDEQGLGGSLLLMPSAAMRATRRSLAVSTSTPVNSSLRGRAPVTASSSWARRTRPRAPARWASSSPWRSGAWASPRRLARRRAAPRSTGARACSSWAWDPWSTATASPSSARPSGPPWTSPSARSEIPIVRGAPHCRANASSSWASWSASASRPSRCRVNAAWERQARKAGFWKPYLQQALAALPNLGADATVSLDVPDQDLPAAFAAAVADDAVDVVIDYLWGRPTEALIAAISRHGLTHAAPRVRLVEVGDSAGATITLPAQVLRSSRLELYGSGAGTIPLDAVMAALPQFIDHAASGELRIGIEQVRLAEVTDAWRRDQPGRRLVLLP
jgi:hypothetical protein